MLNLLAVHPAFIGCHSFALFLRLGAGSRFAVSASVFLSDRVESRVFRFSSIRELLSFVKARTLLLGILQVVFSQLASAATASLVHDDPAGASWTRCFAVAVPSQEQAILVPVNGTLLTVGAEAGDLVRAGDLIAAIDPQAATTRLRIEQETLQVAVSAATRAQLELTLAEEAMKRRFSEPNLFSQEELSHSVFLEKESRQLLAEAQAQVNRARLAARSALREVQLLQVRANFSGRLQWLHASVGDVVQANVAFGQIARFDEPRVQFACPVQLSAAIKRGAQLNLFSFDANLPSISASVEYVELRIDPNSGLVHGSARVNESAGLRIGQAFWFAGSVRP